MDCSLSDERNKLQEDEEKLQTALQEFSDQWDSDLESEEDEDDQLIIDLEYEAAELTGTGQSVARSAIETASLSQSNTFGDEESGEWTPRPSIGLPLQVDAIAQRAGPEKTLALNQALQGILEGHIEAIQEALVENREKQEKLEEDATVNITSQEKKGATSGPFRAPYFRDDSSYPEANEDVTLKNQGKEFANRIDMSKDTRNFQKNSRAILRDAVIEDQLERMLKPLISRMETEIEKRDASATTVESLSSQLEVEEKKLGYVESKEVSKETRLEKKEALERVKEIAKKLEEEKKKNDRHQDQITQLEADIQKQRNTPEDEILASVDPEKVDWMKICKMNYGGSNSWLDCQKAWENQVSSKVNHGQWKSAEEEKLKQLVEDSKTGSWVEIAKELNTGRTPFQCFSHYQSSFNTDLRPRPWTQEEDARLITVVKKVKDSIGICSWRKVCAMMERRSPIECMCRFSKIDPTQRHGRWLDIEDAKLVTAVETLGYKWSKVAKFLGTRNMVQCRDRYMNCLAPNINFTHFTYKEDAALLRLHKQMGNAWAKMVPKFCGRTDNQLLTRYKQLQKWKEQAQWFQKQPTETKKMLLGRSLNPQDKKLMEMKIKDYLSVQLGVKMDDYKRQELDKDNGVDPDTIPPRPPMHLKYFDPTSEMRKGLLSRWSQKLDLHKRLTLSMHQLLARQAKKPKGKGPQQIPEEVTQELMEENVQEITTAGINLNNFTKAQIKLMESALNKAFLNGGTVSVQELVQASKKQKYKRRKGNSIDSKLKHFLRTNRRLSNKPGRQRRFFEKETRPSSVVEAELEEMNHSVPLILMKSFGTDAHSLSKSAKLKKLELQEELANFPTFVDNPTFKQEEAETRAAIEKYRTRTDITDSYRQNRISILNGKLKKLKKVFLRKHDVERKALENEIIIIQDDINYLNSLLNTKTEAEIDKDLSLLAFSPSKATETLSEAGSSPSCLSLASSKSKSSKCQGTPNSSSGPEGHAPFSSQVSEDNISSPESGRRTRSKRKSHPSALDTDEEPQKKKCIFLSEEEITAEREKILCTPKKIVSNLPLFPPNLTTLGALKSLLLMREDLKEKAGKLYQAKRYRRKNNTVDVEIDIAEEESDEEETGLGDANTDDSEENVGGMSGQWFQPTKPQHLSKQAKQFQGFESGKKGRNVTNHPKFDSLIPEVTLDPRRVLPAHLGRFNIKNNKSPPCSPSRVNIYDDNFDIKPSVLQQSEYSNQAADKLSTYNVVLAPTGNINSVFFGPPATSVVSTSSVSTSSSTHSSTDNPQGVKNVLADIPVDSDRNQTYIRISKDDSSQNLTASRIDNNSKPSNNSAIEVIDIDSSENTSDRDTESRSKKKRYSEINGYELPSSKVRRIIKRHRLKNLESDVVLVDVQKDTNNIVHFKSEADKFKAYESITTDVAESPVGRSRSQIYAEKKAEALKKEMKQKYPEHMKKIRKTDEYKLLLARFRSMFMWPVLMSTIQPSTMAGNQESAKVPKDNKGKTKQSKGQWTGKRLNKTRLKNLREARDKARAIKVKLSQQGQTLAVNDKDSWATSQGGESEVGDTLVAEQQTQSENDPKNQGKETVVEGDFEECKPKKRRGRPKGSKSKVSGVITPVERPRRNVRKITEEPVVVKHKGDEPSLHAKVKPQWWKDAVLAAMMSKKALKEDGEEDKEVPIEEDEDFIDKGNYSDDEWVQELREEGAQKQRLNASKIEVVADETVDANKIVSDLELKE